MPAWADVVAVGRALPEVEESTSYGTPSLKVRKKLICRMKEDGETLAVKVMDLEDKEALLRGDPDVFFTTPHFDGYAIVLVPLEAISPADLDEVIVEAWLARAPKRLAASFLETHEGSP